MEKEGLDNFAIVLHEQNLPTKNSDSIRVNMKTDSQEEEIPRNIVLVFRERIYKFSQHVILRNFIIPLLLHMTIITYVTFAVLHWVKQDRKPPLVPYDGLGLLLVIAIISYWSLFYYKYMKPFYLTCSVKPSRVQSPVLNTFLTRSFYVIPGLLFGLFLVYDTNDLNRLRSLLGLVVIFTCSYVFSKHPSHVQWGIVYKGTLLQVIMALCTVRWKAGRLFFEHVGDKIETFLSYSYHGAAFVYSDDLVYKQAIFAFQSLSVIFFVNFIVEILFHLRILQKVFTTLGWCLQKVLGTTAIESVNCCVSVFLGMTEAMLVVKPYLSRLTKSELQAVMLGQLSTVAGSVFAAYVAFGVNPGYLVTASVMSAPAALSLSKLLYPETEPSMTSAKSLSVEGDNEKKYKSTLSAGCDGAISAINMVTGIIASLIAFISLVAFGDAVVLWLATLIGFENTNLVSLLGKVFTPVAYLIGVDMSQCYLVGELISRKVIINEFVAYQKLGEFKAQNLLSRRSEAIATYALCSFSNPGSVAAQIAMISSICPLKLEDATKLAFRAYIGGVVTCFITASIAGLLIPSDQTQPTINAVFNSTNVTMS